jgi:hypothetical protein
MTFLDFPDFNLTPFTRKKRERGLSKKERK